MGKIKTTLVGLVAATSLSVGCGGEEPSIPVCLPHPVQHPSAYLKDPHSGILCPEKGAKEVGPQEVFWYTFKDQMRNEKKPIVLNFYERGFPLCERMQPHYEQLSSLFGERIQFWVVERVKAPHFWLQEMKAYSVPHFQFFYNGEKLAKLTVHSPDPKQLTDNLWKLLLMSTQKE